MPSPFAADIDPFQCVPVTGFAQPQHLPQAAAPAFHAGAGSTQQAQQAPLEAAQVGGGGGGCGSGSAGGWAALAQLPSLHLLASGSGLLAGQWQSWAGLPQAPSEPQQLPSGFLAEGGVGIDRTHSSAAFVEGPVPSATLLDPPALAIDMVLQHSAQLHQQHHHHQQQQQPVAWTGVLPLLHTLPAPSGEQAQPPTPASAPVPSQLSSALAPPSPQQQQQPLQEQPGAIFPASYVQTQIPCAHTGAYSPLPHEVDTSLLRQPVLSLLQPPVSEASCSTGDPNPGIEGSQQRAAA